MRRRFSSFLMLQAIGLIAASFTVCAQERTSPDTVRKMEAAIFQEQDRQRRARIPELATQLSDQDFDKRRTALGQLLEMRLSPEEGVPLFIENLRNSSPVVQQLVVRALAAYGPRARQAIPELIAILGDTQAIDFVRAETAQSLPAIDSNSPDVVTAMIRSLQDRHTVFSLRLAIVRALARLGPVAKEASATLVISLKDPMTAIQCEAYVALGTIEGGPAPLFPPDIERLEQMAPAKSSRAFLAVQRQGTEARSRLPLLVQITQKSPERYLRCAAIRSLGSVGPGQQETTLALLSTLAGEDDYLSSLAVGALEKIGPVDASAVAPLALALAHTNPKVRLQAALALARIGDAAYEAVPALISALDRSTASTNFEEVDAYLEALSAIGQRASSSGPVITASLARDSKLLQNRGVFLRSYLRAHLFVTLARVGVPPESRRFILEALQSDDGYEFAGAAVAAGSLGARGADAVPYLMRALDPDFKDIYMMFTFLMDTTASLEALRALGRIGPRAAAAIPLLERIAQTTSTSFPFDVEARTALQAIRGQGPKPKPPSNIHSPH